MASFFAELRRRHVFRVAAAYVVTAWVVAQVAEFFLESFQAPSWVVQSLLVLLIVGFPVALVLAWAIELRPDEDDRAAGPTVVESEPAHEALAAPIARAESPDPSIAVLPFVDMSSDRDQEYFSDGLSEELLNLLAKVEGLHVASRTSSFSFKGRHEDICDIADKLRVRHVLEGSVRKAGEQVRVTAQLIEAAQGYHLWSETYDRPLDNIFSVQDEIAQSVVAALKLRLLGETPSARETSPEAYNLYLQGMHFFKQRTPESLNRAVQLLERAVEIDPGYAPAWAYLSDAYAVRGGSAGGDWKASVEASRRAVQRALELDSGEAHPWASRSLLKSYYDWDWAGARADMERALQLAPGDSLVHEGMARLARSLGRLEESIAHCDRAITLDPLNWTSHSDRARALMYLGRLDEAEAGFRELIDLNPHHRNGSAMIARIELIRGNIDAALEYNARVQLRFWTEFSRLLICYSHRRDAACETDFAAFRDEFGREGAFQIAEIYGMADERDAAFHWLEIAVEQRDPGLTDELLVTDTLRRLHADSRWEALVDRLGLLDAYRSMPVLA